MLLVNLIFADNALHDLNGFTHAARYNSLITAFSAQCSLIDEHFFLLRVTLYSATEMDSEFEEFFLLCKDITSSKAEMRKILQPLRAHLLKQQLKIFLKIFAIFATICSAIYFVDTFNWYFCAFGRLLLIKMLPVWNWQRLRRSECIIQKTEISSKPKMYSQVLSEAECRVCEHFSNYQEIFFIKNL